MPLTKHHTVPETAPSDPVHRDGFSGGFFKLLPEIQSAPVGMNGDTSDFYLSRFPVDGSDGGPYLTLKRYGDICGAVTALLLMSPVLLVLALLIFAEDRGAVLFCQTRIGKDGKPFRFFKFRSMVRNADALKAKLAAENEASGPIFKMRRDPRITRVGRWLRKYSLDELPQLMNVLRGEMSFVGPRPHLPEEVARYTPRQRQRLSVQPGLICLREVCGRSNLSFERWVDLDLLYIKCRSLRTDARILLCAIPAVLRGDGAY